MTSRERLLCALDNGRPDHLPAQVHGWMQFYLNRYLDGLDWYEAYERFDLDYAIYVSPSYLYDDRSRANWRVERRELGTNAQGTVNWAEVITTPKGTLQRQLGANEITSWQTEYLLKSEADFELWNEFYPIPIKADLTAIAAARDKLGDRGIVRSHPFSPGQGSPWQSFTTLYGTQNAIYLSIDQPEFLHHVLQSILEKTLKVTEMWSGTRADMVETGGGAGSNTVISPKMFREFCLPYDRQQHEALHAVGVKIVYHLCGGLMHQMEMVAENGADGLETMTPPSMGGDCDLAEASRRVGAKLFFIGGFDQQLGFERGSPEAARRLVHECFEATRDHAGYICCPSDHFFHGDPSFVQAFADAAKECVY